MPNPLVMKLEYGARLTEEDRAVLQDLSSRTRHIASKQDIIAERAAR